MESLKNLIRDELFGGPWILFPVRLAAGVAFLLAVLAAVLPFVVGILICLLNDELEKALRDFAKPVPIDMAERRAMIEASIVFVCLMICGAAVVYAFLVG